MDKVRIDTSEKSRNVYFDTNIYNCILDDPNKEEVLKHIKRKNLIIIPSAVNLCELLVTAAQDRRIELISIYNEIRNDFHPLKPFNWLLRDSVESVQSGLEEWEINYPIDTDDITKSLCRELAQLNGRRLEPYLRHARGYIQEVAKNEKFHDEFQYFEFIDSEHGDKILLDIFGQICKSLGVICRLNKDMRLSIIRSPFMPWKYYLESHIYFIYRKLFLNKNYGRKLNPNILDLEQCVYLFWPGKFITEDRIFLEFINRLRSIRYYKVEIMNYSEFKQYLYRET